jgi:hypothetical protein
MEKDQVVEKVRVPFVPGTEHPSTQKAMGEALTARDNADYSAYRLLRVIMEDTDFGSIISSKDRDIWDQWREVRDARESANNKFLTACSGRLEDGSLATDTYPEKEEGSSGSN